MSIFSFSQISPRLTPLSSPPSLSLSQASLLRLRHGDHAHVPAIDAAIAGGLCASSDGTVVVSLHRSGSLVAWAECSSIMPYDGTSRFRPFCSSDGRAATSCTFITPNVVAMGYADANIVLWHVIDQKRGMAWKAHSSGVSLFLVTQGPQDGLASSALFSFSRNGVGQVCRRLHNNVAIQSCAWRVEQLWNVSNGTVLLAWQAADAAVIAAGFLSPGRILVVSADAVVGSVLCFSFQAVHLIVSCLECSK